MTRPNSAGKPDRLETIMEPHAWLKKSRHVQDADKRLLAPDATNRNHVILAMHKTLNAAIQLKRQKAVVRNALNVVPVRASAAKMVNHVATNVRSAAPNVRNAPLKVVIAATMNNLKNLLYYD